jgi:glycosyltransferase involved in cell wall biosynthesis
MATSPPAVSVVIPNHNRAALLGYAVTSALAQEGARVDVLVCDDGSTDESHDVVRAIDDPRVKWLPGPATGGPSAPRNRGIAQAGGDWIAFLDSDDQWLPGKLEAQLRAMESSGCSASSTNAYRWVCGPGTAEAPPIEPEELPLYLSDLPPRLDVRRLLRTNLVVTSAMVVRADLMRATGGFPASSADIFEDYAAWLRVAYLSPIVVLSEGHVVYRDSPQQSYRQNYIAGFTCARNAMRDFDSWRDSLDGGKRAARSEHVIAWRQLIGLLAGPYLPERLRRVSTPVTVPGPPGASLEP